MNSFSLKEHIPLTQMKPRILINFAYCVQQQLTLICPLWITILVRVASILQFILVAVQFIQREFFFNVTSFGNDALPMVITRYDKGQTTKTCLYLYGWESGNVCLSYANPIPVKVHPKIDRKKTKRKRRNKRTWKKSLKTLQPLLLVFLRARLPFVLKLSQLKCVYWTTI